MTSLNLGIVGCGGMGHRHLAGLGELARSGDTSVRLAAVCDSNIQRADALAKAAEALLGTRPRVFADLNELARSDIEAVSCTTETGSHHIVASSILEQGLPVLCEKPVGLTVRASQMVIDAATESGQILSVAENYRRDPINRLTRALIVGGVIGDPQLILEENVGGRDSILITPWRHNKLTGTITIDAGVHSADLLQYFFGPVTVAYGKSRLFERIRHRRETAGPGGFYSQWADEMPEQIEATGEDAAFGLLTFENGAIGHWVEHHAGHGEPYRARRIFGSRGSIVSPGDRIGRPLQLFLDDGTLISDEAILDFAREYSLEEPAATLFGGERPWRYDYPFAVVDRKLIALEYWEFADCIRRRASPEVDGNVALQALSVVYGLLESGYSGQPVSIEDIASGVIGNYQEPIDDHLGLVAHNGAATAAARGARNA